MAVTIRDIAKKAGVSRGTVDRVLHNRKGVNESVAKRVRDIADEMGFTPNLAGKVLARRKQPLRIGCLLPSIGNPFFDEVIAGFRQAERELGDFGVIVDITQIKSFDLDVHLHELKRLAAQQYDGVCVTTLDVQSIVDAIDEITKSGTAVATVNTDIDSMHRLFYVGPDYYLAGRTASGLLVVSGNGGKKRILIVTGSFNMKGHQERIRGFLDGLQAHKADFALVDTVECLDDDTCAYERTRKCLEQHPEINCIYLTAAGVQGACQAVKDLGRENTLRILSFDDVPVTRSLVKEGIITFTICQQPHKHGYDAIHKLFNHLMDQQGPLVDTITQTIIKIRENIEE
ncbi:MAG: LacI family DNA-binding transcriptional regulator [Sphaerochaetaceae bacterium]